MFESHTKFSPGLTEIVDDKKKGNKKQREARGVKTHRMRIQPEWKELEYFGGKVTKTDQEDGIDEELAIIASLFKVVSFSREGLEVSVVSVT